MSKIIPYSAYKEILKYPKYELGVFDCFSVLRDTLKSAFGVELPNYARPEHFDQEPLNLVKRITDQDMFKKRPTLAISQLQAGDILVFNVFSDTANHIGVYLGNNLFLHQLVDSLPREDNLSLAWTRRLREVFYHVDVDQKALRVGILDLMPNHIKEANYVER